MQSRPDDFDVCVCLTGQHRDMVEPVLKLFEVIPDYNLHTMHEGQTLHESTSRIIEALETPIKEQKPDIILVQGDTTSTFCGSLSAFYNKVPVGHIEAGMRTGDMFNPFPEEMNRVLTSQLTQYHFAATVSAKTNLLVEGVHPKDILVTGNTGIDALLSIKDYIESSKFTNISGYPKDKSKKLILVTAHRRENFDNLAHILAAVNYLSKRNDVEIVFPVHPNPSVASAIKIFQIYNKPSENIHFISPMDYLTFVDVLLNSYMILTDSGGVQEEAYTLSKPILVLREKTERFEGLRSCGDAYLVGTDENKIVLEAEKILNNPREYQMQNFLRALYGDGHASERITNFLLAKF